MVSLSRFELNYQYVSSSTSFCQINLGNSYSLDLCQGLHMPIKQKLMVPEWTPEELLFACFYFPNVSTIFPKMLMLCPQSIHFFNNSLFSTKKIFCSKMIFASIKYSNKKVKNMQNKELELLFQWWSELFPGLYINLKLRLNCNFRTSIFAFWVGVVGVEHFR